VRGREPARRGGSGSLGISASEPEQLDRDPVRVAEHDYGLRQWLGDVEHGAVRDIEGVEMEIQVSRSARLATPRATWSRPVRRGLNISRLASGSLSRPGTTLCLGWS
jgi:hypothetical protein